MSLNLSELKQWSPEIADLAASTRQAATNHTGSAEFYRSLATMSGWEGRAADAATAAMEATARDHDAVAENLEKSATGMEHVGQEAEAVAATVKRILDDAAAQPQVRIDESTNAVIPPDTTYMTEEYAAQVAAKVTDLQQRIADVLAEGQRLDADLAAAIATAAGSPQPVTKTASSIGDLLVPGVGERKPASAPRDLNGAIDQLAGAPVAASPRGPVPLDPAKVEQFKVAHETAAATRRRTAGPDRATSRSRGRRRPAPAGCTSVAEGRPDAAARFRRGVRRPLVLHRRGVQGPARPERPPRAQGLMGGLALGTGERIANPVGSTIGDVKDVLNSPSAAYYLGEKSADAAVTAPRLMFGGESALARAGLVDDLAETGGIPHELIDHPPHAVEHPGAHSPLPSHHEMGFDQPVEYHPHAPQAALDLNEAFAQGQPTADLAQQVADMSTHHIGDVDRVILGKYDGQEGGYIGEARNHGGIYYDTGNDT